MPRRLGACVRAGSVPLFLSVLSVLSVSAVFEPGAEQCRGRGLKCGQPVSWEHYLVALVARPEMAIRYASLWFRFNLGLCPRLTDWLTACSLPATLHMCWLCLPVCVCSMHWQILQLYSCLGADCAPQEAFHKITKSSKNQAADISELLRCCPTFY